MNAIPLPLANARRAVDRMWERKYQAFDAGASYELLVEMQKAIAILTRTAEVRYVAWQELGGTSDIHSLAAVKHEAIAKSTPDTIFNLDWDSIEPQPTWKG